MTTERKVVGRAVATKDGQYVRPDGSSYWVAPGEVFDLVEGLTKGRWFEEVKPGAKPALPKPAANPEVPGQGPKKGSKVKIDPAAEDLV